MSNVDISLSAGLSIEESYEQIRSDIQTIQKLLKIQLTTVTPTVVDK